MLLLTKWRPNLVKEYRAIIWARDMPPFYTPSGILIRLLRTLNLVVRGFTEDDLRLHASALTLSTLLAMAPVLALSLALLKGLGYGVKLTDLLQHQLNDLPPQIQNYVQVTMEGVEQASFTKVSSVGAIVLLVMVIQMLTRIETSFNRVWGVSQTRSFVRRVTNYISIVMVVPLLLITGMTVSARLHLDIALVEPLGLARMVPFLEIWLAFSFLYGAIPNTRVRFLPAMASGLVGALLWFFWFQFYIWVQPGVTKYNVLYGTLASVPIFLVWMYVSWTIVLLGGKVTYAVQNRDSWRPGMSRHGASARVRVLLALAILHHTAKAFAGEGPRFSGLEFIRTSQAPPEVMDRVLRLLEKHELLAEVTEGTSQQWVLTRDPELVDVAKVLELVLDEGASMSDLSIDLGHDGFKESLNNTLSWLDEGSVPITGLCINDLTKDEVTIKSEENHA